MKRYSPQVDEYIYAQLREGKKRAQILQELEAGPADLGPVPMPIRTYQDHVRKLIKDRGEPVPEIEPGTELEVAAAIRREGLILARQMIRRLTKREKSDGLNSKEADTLRKLVALTDEVTIRERRTRALESSANPSHRAAKSAKSPTSVLDQLSHRREQKAQPDPSPVAA